jgi:long-chain acyl-CoA synthetase
MGRLDEDGYLFITGRVKELYKLANGKYIAPVPIEEAIALSPFISQAVVHGAGKPYNVALVVPDVPAIVEWAKQHALHATGDELLSAPAVLSLLEAEVDKANGMFKDHERVKRIVIEPEELTSGNGMLTQTLKLKRRTFQEKYGETLERMYSRAAAASPRRVSHIGAFQAAPQPEA